MIDRLLRLLGFRPLNRFRGAVEVERTLAHEARERAARGRVSSRLQVSQARQRVDHADVVRFRAVEERVKVRQAE